MFRAFSELNLFGIWNLLFIRQRFTLTLHKFNYLFYPPVLYHASKQIESINQPILVLGIGNVLLGHEGVGVHAVRMLEKKTYPDHVSFLDGGTGGFHLLYWV